MNPYYLELGFLSGESGPADSEVAWEELKNVSRIMRARTNTILGELMRVETHRNPEDRGKLWRLIEQYHPRFDNQAVVVQEQGTSGRILIGRAKDGMRAESEAVRRAYCRLVIQEMHRRGIEITLRA